MGLEKSGAWAYVMLSVVAALRARFRCTIARRFTTAIARTVTAIPTASSVIVSSRCVPFDEALCALGRDARDPSVVTAIVVDTAPTAVVASAATWVDPVVSITVGDVAPGVGRMARVGAAVTVGVMTGLVVGV